MGLFRFLIGFIAAFVVSIVTMTTAAPDVRRRAAREVLVLGGYLLMGTLLIAVVAYLFATGILALRAG